MDLENQSAEQSPPSSSKKPFVNKWTVFLVSSTLFILLYVTGLLTYRNVLIQQVQKASSQIKSLFSPPVPSTTPIQSPTSTPDKNTDWKTYASPDKLFSFKYPNNWYWEKVPGFPEGNNISFFLDNSTADHTHGDHAGNEIFTITIQEDSRSLEEIKNNYYPSAIDTIIAEKSAIKTGSSLVIIKPSSDKLMYIGAKNPENLTYTNQILSTFKFLEPEKTEKVVTKSCKISGCNSEICQDADEEPIVSICVYLPEHACYTNAACEVQKNGNCDWTQTEELKTCLKKY